MTREQRTAIARIISDMIKADRIIEENESKDMKKFMSDYNTTHQEMSEACKIRFTRLFLLQNLKGCEIYPRCQRYIAPITLFCHLCKAMLQFGYIMNKHLTSLYQNNLYTEPI
jgi:hypothetical protein